MERHLANVNILISFTNWKCKAIYLQLFLGIESSVLNRIITLLIQSSGRKLNMGYIEKIKYHNN